jgi:hypothetical protein
MDPLAAEFYGHQNPVVHDFIVFGN